MKSFSFPPISTAHATILILGTMPGTKSLEIQQYYGHPRNNFWPFMFEILNENFSESYEARKSVLLKHNIALWDVLQFCDRIGSLDSAIKNEISNDFNVFLKNHPHIKTIVFNGQKAGALFKKYVRVNESYTFITLPSTSPANAGKNYEAKLNEWKVIRDLK
ncbi:DNA-deoxyinosine glycosylase [Flavobacterium sp.]|uniref:DNA-deoxyinosine glycosylase n=1 Tax=Flavobacterium sp. TaxID=239 RepID=UPI003264F5D0